MYIHKWWKRQTKISTNPWRNIQWHTKVHTYICICHWRCYSFFAKGPIVRLISKFLWRKFLVQVTPEKIWLTYIKAHVGTICKSYWHYSKWDGRSTFQNFILKKTFQMFVKRNKGMYGLGLRLNRLPNEPFKRSWSVLLFNPLKSTMFPRTLT
jgi:hypothetical protein